MGGKVRRFRSLYQGCGPQTPIMARGQKRSGASGTGRRRIASLSAWANRGFQRRVRIQIARWTIQANRPHSILDAMILSRQALGLENDIAKATALYLAWRESATDEQEGKAVHETHRS